MNGWAIDRVSTVIADLENRFTYHRPTASQPERYERMRAAGLEFARLIARLSPESREQSIAFTKIDEAVMWANAAIARNEDAP